MNHPPLCMGSTKDRTEEGTAKTLQQLKSFPSFFSLSCLQGILFCTSECLKTPQDLLKIYLHESNRVYRDKMVEDRDFHTFDKLQADTARKFYEVRGVGVGWGGWGCSGFWSVALSCPAGEQSDVEDH